MFDSWLCLLLLDVSIGRVSHFFQNVSFFPIIVFGLHGSLTLLCFWEISFSGQMILVTVSWLLDLIESSSDHMIILVVRLRSWKELEFWGWNLLNSVQYIFHCFAYFLKISSVFIFYKLSSGDCLAFRVN